MNEVNVTKSRAAKRSELSRFVKRHGVNMKTELDENRFYKNLAGFFAVGLFWTLLDVIFGKTTDITDLLIIGFFIVWNVNICRKDKDV